jgi:predicted anti-sigma-YlaC factor YlaD
MKTLDHETLKKLVYTMMHAQEQEMTCDDCLEEMDRFAEAQFVGKELDEALASVQQHLSQCAFCREEFEALMNALRSLS